MVLQSQKKSVLLFTVLCSIFISACNAENKNNAISAIATPSVIDFGKVRSGNSVISFFKIENTGTNQLDITNILCGCSCTDANISKTTILPNEIVEGSIKTVSVNFVGNFSSEVWIKFASHRTLIINVHGEFIKDIWYNGQTIRSTVASHEEYVQARFSLYTVEYPNVEFDWKHLENEGIAVTEISRNTNNGETEIIMELNVFVGTSNHISKRIFIKPENNKILPFTIDFECFRGIH